ncbi:MAG TPA: glycosyltransferase [Saprospiraceae bacterium]|nr:glycosyltransferase [Saprospiraceae bacterium]HMQ84907.1 glycosyltransferase [Saprospiraceae bacterium]
MILLLSPAYPLRGGIASSSERLAQAFQQQGKEVEICSFRLQYPHFLFPGKTQYATDDPAPDLTIHTWVNSINPFNWLWVGWKLRQKKPDLIIVRFWIPFMGPCLGAILRLAKSNGHTRIIAITDNVIPHEKRPGDRLFTRWFIGAVDAFVVMSRSVEGDIRQFTPTKPVRYIPHPIYDNYGEKISRELALKQLGLASDKSYLLFFGFIRDYKGLDLLLEAMRDDRLRKMPIHLLVAGEFYTDPAPYHQMVAQAELGDRVSFYGDYIPNEQVKYYFGAADLVVQPYKSATQSGISQMAYHFGKPMVVTRVGGLPEIVEHGKAGYVVAVEPAAIADAIADFFENQRQKDMESAVHLASQQFSWENMVEGLEALKKGEI